MVFQVYIYGLPNEAGQRPEIGYLIKSNEEQISQDSCSDIGLLVLALNRARVLTVNPNYRLPSNFDVPGAFTLPDSIVRDIEAIRTRRRTAF